MPTRSSRHTAESAYIKRAVPFHAVMITIGWVAGIFFAIGCAMVFLLQMARLLMMQRYVDAVVRQQIQMQQELREAQNAFAALEIARGARAPTRGVENLVKSPSGALVRGSFSPDGKKYAGYDDVTKGKQGIGVEVVGETRVRHIEIFNPATESSGAKSAEGASLSVRWNDNQTIEFDILVTRADGTQAKETRTTKIYF